MDKLMARFYWIIGVFSFVVLAISGVQFVQFRNNVYDQAMADLEAGSIQIQQGVETFLRSTEAVVAKASSLMSYYHGDATHGLTVLQALFQEESSLASLYFLSTENQMYNASGYVPPPELDFRNRPWYVKALEENKMIVTDVFLNASRDRWIVSMATPVYDAYSQEVVGVVGADVDLDYVMNLVREHSFGLGGYSFLLDSKNELLSHPSYSRLRGETPELAKTLPLSLFSEKEAIITSLDGERGYLTVRNIVPHDWHLGSFLSVMEVRRTVSRLVLGLSLSLLTILVALFALYLFLKQRVLHPILELEDQIESLDVSKRMPGRLLLPPGHHFSSFIRTINGLLDNVAAHVKDVSQAKADAQQSGLKIERLHETAVALSQVATIEEACLIAAQAAEGVLNFVFCVVDVVEGDRLVVKATSRGLPQGVSRDMALDYGLAGKTYQSQKTFYIPDISQEPSVEAVNPLFRSCISSPVGRLGVFQVISSALDGFKSEDIRMAEILTSHLEQAIKRIRFEDEIRRVSFHDRLTGLYNRAFFEEELSRLNCEAYLPLGVIIGDINGLKLANDAFGHREGDALLQEVAEILSGCVRDQDVVARWGGDEFAVLLPNTQEADAQEIVRSIKEESLKSTSPIPVSISLGLASKVEVDTHIYKVIARAEEVMYRNKLLESKSVRNAIILSLEKSLLEKSNETEEHTFRIQQQAVNIGKQLGLSTELFDELALLASLHDIGKIAISEEILNKPSKLTEEEWVEIKRHPEIGYRIALSSPELAPIAEGILSHHERWDGMGYPRGLKEEEIPLTARIITILDSYDVMLNGRPYKEPFTHEMAVAELRRCAGTQFDPVLVELFIHVVGETVEQPVKVEAKVTP